MIEKIKRRLTWFGHVERMEGKRLPNAALHAVHGHVRGKRSRGRQKKRWLDNVREDLENRGIQLSMAVVPKLGVTKCFLGVAGFFEVKNIFEEILIYCKGG